MTPVPLAHTSCRRGVPGIRARRAAHRDRVHARLCARSVSRLRRGSAPVVRRARAAPRRPPAGEGVGGRHRRRRSRQGLSVRLAGATPIATVSGASHLAGRASWSDTIAPRAVPKCSMPAARRCRVFRRSGSRGSPFIPDRSRGYGSRPTEMLAVEITRGPRTNGSPTD